MLMCKNNSVNQLILKYTVSIPSWFPANTDGIAYNVSSFIVLDLITIQVSLKTWTNLESLAMHIEPWLLEGVSRCWVTTDTRKS